MILYLILALWLYRRHRRGKKEDRDEIPENLSLYGSVFFLIAALFSLYEVIQGQKHPMADAALLVIALGFVVLFVRAERESAKKRRSDWFDDAKDKERQELLDLPRNSIRRYRGEKKKEPLGQDSDLSAKNNDK